LDQNEEATAHYKKMYDRVSALAKIGVWECDLASGRLTWTDTVYDIFGLPRGSVVSREDALKLYRPDSRVEMERLRSRAISTGIGFALDVQLAPAGGKDRWIRLTAEIEKEAGKPVRIFGTKQDISAEKAAQDKVQSLQNELIHVSRVSAMGAMASTLAHEVNQPLTAASNYLAVARRLASREPVRSDLSECIQAALESIQQAGSTIRSVREMSAKRRVTEENLELEQVVKEAARLATKGNPNVTLSCDIGGAPPVKADRIQIQQVLINLIRNACEAADGRPCHISINGTASEAHLELCVSDNGPGIPVAVLPRIFEAFVSTKPGGVGIGLSISRTIVEAHGGHIRAMNLPEGGTMLCFTLPLAERRSSASSRRCDRRLGRQGKGGHSVRA
jgi:two-component system, LuxR family, sensor kinase FixL